MRTGVWAMALGVLGVIACGTSAQEDELDYCAVEPILEAKCFGCHSESPRAPVPFSLVGAAAFQEPYGGRPRHEAALRAIDTDYMPFGVDSGIDGSGGPLDPDEKELLVEWLEAGAPDCR